jgi:hypothetical protein
VIPIPTLPPVNIAEYVALLKVDLPVNTLVLVPVCVYAPELPSEVNDAAPGPEIDQFGSVIETLTFVPNPIATVWVTFEVPIFRTDPAVPFIDISSVAANVISPFEAPAAVSAIPPSVVSNVIAFPDTTPVAFTSTAEAEVFEEFKTNCPVPPGVKVKASPEVVVMSVAAPENTNPVEPIVLFVKDWAVARSTSVIDPAGSVAFVVAEVVRVNALAPDVVKLPPN